MNNVFSILSGVFFEIKSAFLQFSWIVKNRIYKVFHFKHNTKLDESFCGNDFFKTLKKVDATFKKYSKSINNSENRMLKKGCEILYFPDIPESASKFIQIQYGNSENEILRLKLQNGLQEGVCFGASVSLLMKAKSSSLSEGFKKLEKEEIDTFQLSVDSLFYLNKLKDSLQEEAAQEVRGMQEEIARFLPRESILERPFFCLQDQGVASVRAELTKRDKKKFMIEMQSADGQQTGHCIALDLENYEFFDTNTGLYKYRSKEAAIEQTLQRIQRFYPYYLVNNSQWIFHPI